MATIKELIEKAGQVAVLKAHPVGSYFITEEDRNPAEILGLGGVSTWVKLEGRVLLGASSTYPVGSEGGGTMEISGGITTEPNIFTNINGTEQNSVHGDGYGAIKATYGSTITGYFGGAGTAWPTYYHDTGWDFKASRNWTGSTSTAGSGQPHNNLQPYRSAYIWRRTA